MVQLGQYPKAQQVLVHLSDTHFLSGGALLHGDLPAESTLERALEQVESMGISPSALVFTGDLTDEGETDAYARLRERVEPVARRLGAEVIWLMGNHDEPGAMRSALLDEEASDAPVDRVWDLGGLRFIGLDSSVPGFHHGELTDAQLDWLDAVLDVPARLGTVIGMHHPPVPAPQPLFDLLELRHQRPFAEVLAGRDVRAILAGHLHYSLSSTFADVPVSVAAATCYTMNLSRPPREANGMNGGQSFNLVHVYDQQITHSVVPIGDFETADTFSAEFIAEMEALSPDERVEAFSRKR
ncbi:phosphodiesterase [Mycetocola zhujimingii]|uniref:Phosphodiesterase n=1 Tax=Mycetocola zhujimingii TaxID=2079792 RepID=A0A2U1TEL7_9MICO|nr:phosphodiesterase [Mycetocola zhujimingii]PWC07260.1 phosphodiesterase [Mycetocola zhujimingii]